MLFEYSREFIALASSLNFTETARALGLTQPTLSRHIADLESDVGCTLLRRFPVELTPEGAFYLETVSPIVAEFETALEKTRTLHARSRHHVLAFARPVENGYPAYLYNIAATNLAAAVPSVTLVLKDHATKSLCDLLRSGEIDCGFTYARPENTECAFLYSTETTVCMRKDNPLAEKSPLRVSDVQGCLLSFTSDKTYEEWAEGQRRVCRLAGFEPRFSLKQCHQLIDMAISLRRNEVILGDAAVLTTSIFPDEVFVTRLFDDDPPIEHVCYLAFSPSADREAVDLLVDALREAARANGLNTDEALVRGEPA